MSHAYAEADRPLLDYQLVDVDGLPWPVRGPVPDLDAPFFVCIGSAHTFGRFCERPYATLLAQRLGLPVLNLGVGGTGPAFFRKPEHLAILRRARFVVCQVQSGRSAGNSRFLTDGGYQGRVLDTGEVGTLSVQLDRWLRDEPRDVVERLIAETRSNYVAHSRALLEAIGRPTVLFWFSSRSPDYTPGFANVRELQSDYPHLVDRATVDAIRPHAARYVECVSQRGLPQRLWAAEEPVLETHVGSDGWLHNVYYPSPEMHEDAATALTEACVELAKAPPPAAPLPPLPGSTARLPVWFVVVSSERTGSTLLVSLLASHPDIGVAGEVFNGRHADDPIPWAPVEDRLDLIGLRRENFRELLVELAREAILRDKAAFGFKLHYSQAETRRDVVELLRSIHDLRVVHLVRENRLRRLLSHERAQRSDEWVRLADRGGEGRGPAPIVALDFEACVEDFATHIEHEQQTRLVFAGKRLLELTYERLAADPAAAAAEVLDFLDLPRRTLTSGTAKTGERSLRTALANHDELKARFAEWLSWCDETEPRGDRG